MSTDDAVPRPGGLALASFSIATVLGGANFLGVRFSNRELEPFWGAGLRFSIAAALFVVIALVLRLPWPRGRQLTLTMGYGLLTFTATYALMYWALVQVTAGVGTVVLAVVPLVTLLLAAAQHHERLTARAVAGSFLALAGIGWMLLGPRDVLLPPMALLAMGAAALAIGQSVILAKRVSQNHPAMTNAVGISTGAVGLLILSAIMGDAWVLPRQPEVILAVGYLVTLGSAGLFVLTLLVVRTWTASATSYMFVLFPFVTLLLGAWLANEPITSEALVGAVLVMAGVWFGALSPGAKAAASTPPAAQPAATGSR